MNEMTPARYRECLNALGLSQRGLAPRLGCDSRLTRGWAMGENAIPARVAEWLEAAVAHRVAEPKPPVGWQARGRRAG